MRRISSFEMGIIKGEGGELSGGRGFPKDEGPNKEGEGGWPSLEESEGIGGS